MSSIKQFPAYTTFDLAAGSVLPLAAAASKRVRVVSGRIWLTEEGCAQDAFLARGAEVALAGSGLAVIEALSPARLQLFESSAERNGVRGATRHAAQTMIAWWRRQLDFRPREASCS